MLVRTYEIGSFGRFVKEFARNSERAKGIDINGIHDWKNDLWRQKSIRSDGVLQGNLFLLQIKFKLGLDPIG